MVALAFKNFTSLKIWPISYVHKFLHRNRLQPVQGQQISYIIDKICVQKFSLLDIRNQRTQIAHLSLEMPLLGSPIELKATSLLLAQKILQHQASARIIPLSVVLMHLVQLRITQNFWHLLGSPQDTSYRLMPKSKDRRPLVACNSSKIATSWLHPTILNQLLQPSKKCPDFPGVHPFRIEPEVSKEI